MKTITQHLCSKRWLPIAVLCVLLPFLISTISPSADLPSVTLTQRQLCDLELLMDGSFAPLKTFMNSKDYERVVHEMRLADGTLWPIPIILDITEKSLGKIKEGKQIALKDSEGFTLALLDVEEIWQPNKKIEAEKVYGTVDPTHPGVNYLFNRTGDYYLSGKLIQVQAPLHFDFADLRKTPAELKSFFKEHGLDKVVAFQTRQPMHRTQMELTMCAAKETEGHLLIHPAIGMTHPGDVDYFTRVKCYKQLLSQFPKETVTLSLLPLAMRMGGPREALWHAIIRKNYGCTHFIVGKDHAGAGQTSNGSDFYSPYAAQELVKKYAQEIGIAIIPVKEFVYVQEDDCYQSIEDVGIDKTIFKMSESELKKRLHEGLDIPAWFTFPEITTELRKIYPPRSEQGFTLFFTGLSGSGKSTLAKAVAAKLAECQDRPITLLDGDVIRTHLSSELGFSREHRALNVRRVGFVASEITKNKGIAICPMIAPYASDRNYNRELISAVGNFIEVYISTSFDTCAERDTKGFYALAKEGKITGFTGVDDPYEVPSQPEITIDTTRYTLSEGVDLILDYLRQVKHIN